MPVVIASAQKVESVIRDYLEYIDPRTSVEKKIQQFNQYTNTLLTFWHVSLEFDPKVFYKDNGSLVWGYVELREQSKHSNAELGDFYLPQRSSRVVLRIDRLVHR